jgi:hypothetical protein
MGRHPDTLFRQVRRRLAMGRIVVTEFISLDVEADGVEDGR